MTRFRTLLLAVLFLSGCTMLQDAMRTQPAPTVRLAGVILEDISLTQATLNFDLAVTNNYSVPLPVANVAYSVASGGQPFLTGSADLQTTIAVGETKTLRLPAKFTYLQIVTAVKNIRPGAVMPYDAKLDVSVDVPIAGRVAVPLAKSGQIPIPNVPSIDITAIRWQELSLTRATAVLDLKVGNTSQFDMTLSQLGGALSLAGISVGDIAAKSGPALKPGQEGSVQIPITISPENLGISVIRMLSGSGSDYKLAGSLNIGTPFGAMQIPYDRSGKVSFSH